MFIRWFHEHIYFCHYATFRLNYLFHHFIYLFEAGVRSFWIDSIGACRAVVLFSPRPAGGSMAQSRIFLQAEAAAATTARDVTRAASDQTTWRCPSVLLVSVSWLDGLCPPCQRDTGLSACWPGRASFPPRPRTVSQSLAFISAPQVSPRVTVITDVCY